MREKYPGTTNKAHYEAFLHKNISFHSLFDISPSEKGFSPSHALFAHLFLSCLRECHSVMTCPHSGSLLRFFKVELNGEDCWDVLVNTKQQYTWYKTSCKWILLFRGGGEGIRKSIKRDWNRWEFFSIWTILIFYLDLKCMVYLVLSI